jgi:5'(3')-deoxyribonucleotidase
VGRVSKPVLAIDMDEVIFPFTLVFLEHHNKQNGTAVEMNDLQTYYFIEELLGIESSEVEKVLAQFLEASFTQQSGPYPETVEAIQQLKQKYDIHIITARHHTMMDSTHKWFKKHLPDTFHGIHFNRPAEGVKRSKAEMCVELGASVLIDDHIENLLDCADHGIRALCFGDYPWQADIPEEIERVKDWNEVLEVLL